MYFLKFSSVVILTPPPLPKKKYYDIRMLWQLKTVAKDVRSLCGRGLTINYNTNSGSIFFMNEIFSSERDNESGWLHHLAENPATSVSKRLLQLPLRALVSRNFRGNSLVGSKYSISNPPIPHPSPVPKLITQLATK